jgi:hypothetical protein
LQGAVLDTENKPGSLLSQSFHRVGDNGYMQDNVKGFCKHQVKEKAGGTPRDSGAISYRTVHKGITENVPFEEFNISNCCEI